MASSDEYQQIQFWESLKKERLFCEEIKSRHMYPLTPSQCVESDKDGKCLMSAQSVILDMSTLPDQVYKALSSLNKSIKPWNYEP